MSDKNFPASKDEIDSFVILSDLVEIDRKPAESTRDAGLDSLASAQTGGVKAASVTTSRATSPLPGKNVV